jgi:hypothetical protein
LIAISQGDFSLSREPDDILSRLVDSSGRCKICGKDHSHNPTFEDVKISIDVILELFSKDSKPKIVKEV